MTLQLEVGAMVAGRYRLDRRLGEGGMGTVWSATHAVTRRSVALKFLGAHMRVRPEAHQRFLREARAAAAVDHPNVVSVHDVFELEDGLPVMVMDLLEGETLGKKIARDAPLDLEEVATLLLPVVSAVGTAHSLGVVHRDLKPDNVFLTAATGGLTVKVLDFGIAKLTAEEEAGTLTGTGNTLGTPCYMSPEQGFGEKDVDHRADVWAIGVILYEALTGGRPVEGDTLGQVLKRLMDQAITPIWAVVPGLEPEVAALVMRMLERERTDRPADLREAHAILSKHAAAPAPTFGAPHDPRASSTRNARVEVDGDAVDETGRTREASSDRGASGPETAGPHSVTIGRPHRRTWAYAAIGAAGVGAIVGWRALAAAPAPEPPGPEEITAGTSLAAPPTAAPSPSETPEPAPTVTPAPAQADEITSAKMIAPSAPAGDTAGTPTATARRPSASKATGRPAAIQPDSPPAPGSKAPSPKVSSGKGGLVEDPPF